MIKYFTLFISSFILILQTGYSAPPTENKLEIVIFGATGDLTSRKILPALYHLSESGHLPAETSIIGIGRRELSNERFREQLQTAVKPTDSVFWKTFAQSISYHMADIEKDDGFDTLAKKMSPNSNRIYFLATQPKFFPIVIKKLQENKLIHDGEDDKKWSRVIIEKPFGEDLSSAVDLQKEISQYLSENQIYRIDHYLGKEGIQNLLQFRFAGGLFEPLWNKQYVDNIQLTISEKIGIEGRAQFWEETGLLRDILQNHLMQMIALVAMEPPQTLEPKDIQAEKKRLLESIRSLNPPEVVRGQYGTYTQEKGIPADSKVETFAAMKMMIDNDRWDGVPFYIRSGKRLAEQIAEIVVNFKDGNALVIRIQPDAGIFLHTMAKVPGLENTSQPIVFGYQPENYFGKRAPEAYEKLLYDCIRGDSSLFVPADEQLAAWRLLTPVLDYWKTHPQVLEYKAGSYGPIAADELLQKDGRNWRN